MKKKTILALLLAGCCLLTGCSKTASDEDVFGPPEPMAQQTEKGEEPSPSAPAEESAAPDASDALPEESAPASQAPEAVSAPISTEEGSGEPYIDAVTMTEDVNLGEELVPMSAAPAMLSSVLSPVASGTSVKAGGGAEIDYSNTKDGYVMCRFAAASSKRIRVQVTGPTTTYTYDLPTGAWVTYPLSDGNGAYKVTVLQNTTGKKYAVLASASFQVLLADEFAPFLRPNQYVNYEGAANTVATAAQLTGNISDPLQKVGAVYNYVVKNLSYDQRRANAVATGALTSYLPDLDNVLAEKKGICFDYAALMTGMLRSQGVPCKLVVGYAGTTYHAWVSVWTQETGWVDGAIYFDGTTWHRMDPTFASSGNSSDQIMQFIGNGSNYKVKYLY